MSDVNNLKEKIDDLEKQLEKKVLENRTLYSQLENLEDTIIKYEKLIDEGDSGDLSKKLLETKLAMENNAKEIQIREYKDQLGYLRKENIDLKRHIKKLTKKDPDSVIRITEKKQPLESLVKELQRKINKQEIMISQLKKKSSESAKLHLTVGNEDETIERYKLKISELNHQLETVKEQTEHQITEKLTKEFQANLKKVQSRVEKLKVKLANCERKGKKKSPKKEGAEITSLQNQIMELKELVKRKEKKIEELQMSEGGDVSSMDKTQVKLGSVNAISDLNEELQRKLNKSKMQIKVLQDQLNDYKKMENISEETSTMESKASEQLINQLQEKITERDRLIEIKDDQYNTIKNEAIEINSKLKELEKQLRLKDKTINDFKSQLESIKAENLQQKLDIEDSQLSLRFREMRSLIDDLKKQIMEQRLEISQLREK